MCYFSFQVVLEHVDQLAGSENFERTILKFDENFSQQLVGLLDKVMEYSQGSCEHKLMNILYRYQAPSFPCNHLPSPSPLHPPPHLSPGLSLPSPIYA